MTTKKLAIVTYGCQMNKYDSERIVGLLQQADYELTEHIATRPGCSASPP